MKILLIIPIIGLLVVVISVMLAQSREDYITAKERKLFLLMIATIPIPLLILCIYILFEYITKSLL